jgi:hypothetical protein
LARDAARLFTNGGAQVGGNLIAINTENWITVLLMAAAGYLVFALLVTFFKSGVIHGTGSSAAPSAAQ